MVSTPLPQTRVSPLLVRLSSFWQRSKRWIIPTVLVLIVLWLGFVRFVWWSMHQPPEKFATIMSRMPGPVVFLAAPFETMWTVARAGNLTPGSLG